MIAQEGAEVIVVDYSCPQNSGDYVEKNFPSVVVVRVENQKGFSNWRGRNLGAQVATGNMFLFCDADTILAPNALKVIDESVADGQFGYFTRNSSAHFNKSGLRLGKNQLRGFQVVPAKGFRMLEGYDAVPSGYAAGGDTDLEERLVMLGIKRKPLGDGIVDEVIEHDNATRFTYHRNPIGLSYGAGLLYRRAKMALLKLHNTTTLPLNDRKKIYAVAFKSAQQLAQGKPVASMNVNIEKSEIGMPRQLGFEEGHCTVSITVKLSMDKKISVVPER
jgi:glycosyltransferase involved in cell wall biosynthesis